MWAPAATRKAASAAAGIGPEASRAAVMAYRESVNTTPALVYSSGDVDVFE